MKVLVTGPGHSCTNWALEIVRASEQFDASGIVEDKGFFRKKLKHNYLTKLSPEQPSMTWKNLHEYMEKYKDLFVIFCLRHPIDNALSKIKRQHNPDRDPIEYTYDGTKGGAVKALEAAYDLYFLLLEHYPQRVMAIKLEDLIKNTRETIDNVANFLAVEHTEKMDNAHAFTRNVFQQERYNGKIVKSQLNLYAKWDIIYDKFFAEKEELIKFLKKHLNTYCTLLGYKRL